jgi:hypothetical protein
MSSAPSRSAAAPSTSRWPARVAARLALTWKSNVPSPRNRDAWVEIRPVPGPGEVEVERELAAVPAVEHDGAGGVSRGQAGRGERHGRDAAEARAEVVGVAGVDLGRDGEHALGAVAAGGVVQDHQLAGRDDAAVVGDLLELDDRAVAADDGGGRGAARGERRQRGDGGGDGGEQGGAHRSVIHQRRPDPIAKRPHGAGAASVSPCRSRRARAGRGPWPRPDR